MRDWTSTLPPMGARAAPAAKGAAPAPSAPPADRLSAALSGAEDAIRRHAAAARAKDVADAEVSRLEKALTMAKGTRAWAALMPKHKAALDAQVDANEKERIAKGDMDLKKGGIGRAAVDDRADTRRQGQLEAFKGSAWLEKLTPEEQARVAARIEGAGMTMNAAVSSALKERGDFTPEAKARTAALQRVLTLEAEKEERTKRGMPLEVKHMTPEERNAHFEDIAARRYAVHKKVGAADALAKSEGRADAAALRAYAHELEEAESAFPVPREFSWDRISDPDKRRLARMMDDPNSGITPEARMRISAAGWDAAMFADAAPAKGGDPAAQAEAEFNALPEAERTPEAAARIAKKYGI